MGKRFVTYRTEDQQAGLVNVDENGVLKTGVDEGGSGGGTIVATGTPEEVSKCTNSYTGMFIKDLLSKKHI